MPAQIEEISDSEEVQGQKACGDCMLGTKYPAHRASALGHTACLGAILDKLSTASPGSGKQTPLGKQLVDPDLNTPVHAAAANGQIESLQFLLEKTKISVCAANNRGYNAAHFAAERGRLEILKLLLSGPLERAKALAFQRDAVGCTCLHLAVLRSDNDIGVWLLQRFGKAIANIPDQDFVLPLHIAAARGNVEFIQVASKFDVLMIGKRDRNGATPVFYAVQAGHLDCVRYLVEKCRADLSSTTHKGHTLLHVACLNGHLLIVSWLLRRLDRTPSLAFTQRTSDGATFFHCAAYNGHFNVLRMLLKAGGAPGKKIMLTSTDRAGNLPLHLTAQNDHIYSAKLLLELGANPKAKNRNGQTPFDLAREACNTQMLELLNIYLLNGMAKRNQEPKSRSVSLFRFLRPSRSKSIPPQYRMDGDIDTDSSSYLKVTLPLFERNGNGQPNLQASGKTTTSSGYASSQENKNNDKNINNTVQGFENSPKIARNGHFGAEFVSPTLWPRSPHLVETNGRIPSESGSYVRRHKPSAKSLSKYQSTESPTISRSNTVTSRYAPTDYPRLETLSKFRHQIYTTSENQLTFSDDENVVIVPLDPGGKRSHIETKQKPNTTHKSSPDLTKSVKDRSRSEEDWNARFGSGTRIQQDPSDSGANTPTRPNRSARHRRTKTTEIFPKTDDSRSPARKPLHKAEPPKSPTRKKKSPEKRDKSTDEAKTENVVKRTFVDSEMQTDPDTLKQDIIVVDDGESVIYTSSAEARLSKADPPKKPMRSGNRTSLTTRGEEKFPDKRHQEKENDFKQDTKPTCEQPIQLSSLQVATIKTASLPRNATSRATDLTSNSSNVPKPPPGGLETKGNGKYQYLEPFVPPFISVPIVKRSQRAGHDELYAQDRNSKEFFAAIYSIQNIQKVNPEIHRSCDTMMGDRRGSDTVWDEPVTTDTKRMFRRTSIDANTERTIMCTQKTKIAIDIRNLESFYSDGASRTLPLPSKLRPKPNPVMPVIAPPKPIPPLSQTASLPKSILKNSAAKLSTDSLDKEKSTIKTRDNETKTTGKESADLRQNVAPNPAEGLSYTHGIFVPTRTPFRPLHSFHLYSGEANSKASPSQNTSTQGPLSLDIKEGQDFVKGGCDDTGTISPPSICSLGSDVANNFDDQFSNHSSNESQNSNNHIARQIPAKINRTETMDTIRKPISEVSETLSGRPQDENMQNRKSTPGNVPKLPTKPNRLQTNPHVSTNKINLTENGFNKITGAESQLHVSKWEGSIDNPKTVNLKPATVASSVSRTSSKSSSVGKPVQISRGRARSENLLSSTLDDSSDADENLLRSQISSKGNIVNAISKPDSKLDSAAESAKLVKLRPSIGTELTSQIANVVQASKTSPASDSLPKSVNGKPLPKSEPHQASPKITKKSILCPNVKYQTGVVIPSLNTPCTVYYPAIKNNHAQNGQMYPKPGTTLITNLPKIASSKNHSGVKTDSLEGSMIKSEQTEPKRPEDMPEVQVSVAGLRARFDGSKYSVPTESNKDGAQLNGQLMIELRAPDRKHRNGKTPKAMRQEHASQWSFVADCVVNGQHASQKVPV